MRLFLLGAYLPTNPRRLTGARLNTFSVKDYAKFQHYKDRSPPWIKLYNSTLDDYAFGSLPDASKYHLIAIWLLASRSANKIPYDPEWVAKRINATETVNLELLVEAGFLLLDQPLPTPEHDASTTQAERLSRERGRGRGREDDFVDEAREREPAKPPSESKQAVSPSKAEAIALGLAFVQAAGFRDHADAPMNWYGVSNRAAQWIANGWTEAMIVAETRIVTVRAGTAMPVAYYEKCFATAAARAAQPLPIAIVKEPETVNVVRADTTARSVSNAFDRLARRLEQGDAEPSGAGGEGFGRLLA